jgi:Trypsin-like peptidase domain
LRHGIFVVNSVIRNMVIRILFVVACGFIPAVSWGQIVEPLQVQQPGTQSPHPAVVRIYVAEGKSQSIGSGTLIDVRDKYGLVISNWHVIRDAKGEISVVFPDGFRSAARVVSFDQDWDLAALSIWRPQAQPVSVAIQPPQPGEPLTIAGYGSEGVYRVATGKCTQYLAPSTKHPYELVELSAAARQGDSGGPIFNQRGELAGVLFGSVEGTTAGSYGGRVWKFVEPLLQANQLHATPPAATLATASTTAPSLLSDDAAKPQMKPDSVAENKPVVITPTLVKSSTLEPIPTAEITTSAPDIGIRTPTPFPYRVPNPVSFQGDALITPSSDPSGNIGTGSVATGNDVTNELIRLFVGQSPMEQGKAFFSLIGLGTVAAWFLRWNQEKGKE